MSVVARTPIAPIPAISPASRPFLRRIVDDAADDLEVGMCDQLADHHLPDEAGSLDDHLVGHGGPLARERGRDDTTGGLGSCMMPVLLPCCAPARRCLLLALGACGSSRTVHGPATLEARGRPGAAFVRTPRRRDVLLSPDGKRIAGSRRTTASRWCSIDARGPQVDYLTKLAPAR
jgi:hypothetical protein